MQFADVTRSLSWQLPLCIKTTELHTPGMGDSITLSMHLTPFGSLR